MPGLLYLADTNILLRLIKSNDPEFPLVRRAVHALKARGERLCYVPQNIVEFWNVCTRPPDRIGCEPTVNFRDELTVATSGSQNLSGRSNCNQCEGVFSEFQPA